MTDVAKILVGGVTYPIKAPSVEDNGRGGDNLKFWTGVRADYDHLVDNREIDDGTLYYLSDTHEVYLGILYIANYSSPRTLGEVVSATFPITDAGLHLLDGSLLTSGGMFDDFVNYMSNLWETTPASGYRMNVSTVGNPTLNSATGIASGFTTANYLYPTTSISFSAAASGADSWEETFKFKVTSVDTVQTITGENSGTYCHHININADGNFTLSLSSSGTAYDIFGGAGTHVVETNVNYWVKLAFTGTQYILSYSTNGQEYTEDIVVDSVVHIENTTDINYIGARGNLGYPLQGEIDLKECVIKIDGNIWWVGAGPIKRGFCTETEWQQSITTRGVCGKYVYDDVNKTIRLPKITGFVEGTAKEAKVGDGDKFLSPATTGTDPITNVLYYVVVAEGYRTPVEINIDNAVSAINNKVDKFDLREIQCLVDYYRSGTSWYRVYSDGWCEQGGRIYIGSGGTVGVSRLKPYINTDDGIFHSYYTTSVNSYGCRVRSYVTWRTEGYIV